MGDNGGAWKGNGKYSQELCAKIVELYIDKEYGYGLSDTAVACSLGISRETFYEWLKKYPEFAEQVRRGRAESEQATSRTLMRCSLDGSKVAMAFPIFYMKNVHRWRDNQPVNVDAEDEQYQDTLKEERERLKSTREK